MVGAIGAALLVVVKRRGGGIEHRTQVHFGRWHAYLVDVDNIYRYGRFGLYPRHPPGADKYNFGEFCSAGFEGDVQRELAAHGDGLRLVANDTDFQCIAGRCGNAETAVFVGADAFAAGFDPDGYAVQRIACFASVTLPGNDGLLCVDEQG